MKKKHVFDAGVISLYFAGRDDVKRYFNEIFKGDAEGFICEVNLAEFYYKAIKKIGLEATEIRYIAIREKLNVGTPDEKMTRDAARIKARHENTLSLADSYTIALNEKVKGTLLTTDSGIKNSKETKTILIKI